MENSDFLILDEILIRYNGSKENVVIPNTVSRIVKNAFKNCSTFKSVTIPDNVTRIDWNAFFTILNYLLLHIQKNCR